MSEPEAHADEVERVTIAIRSTLCVEAVPINEQAAYLDIKEGTFEECARAAIAALSSSDRLRGALEKIANHDGVSYRFGDEVREIARTALEAPTDKGGEI